MDKPCILRKFSFVFHNVETHNISYRDNHLQMNQIFVSLSLMHSIYFYYRFLINSKSKQAREVSYLAQAAIIKTGWLKQQTFNSQCYRGSPRLRCWQIRFLVRALFPLPGLRTSALPLHDGGREERMNRGKEGERKRKRDT